MGNRPENWDLCSSTAACSGMACVLLSDGGAVHSMWYIWSVGHSPMCCCWSVSHEQLSCCMDVLMSTQAHLLSDYSTFCTCWHHFQAFLLCQLLFSASLLSRWFNIASLTLRSWQWGGQSMMTVLHWGGCLYCTGVVFAIRCFPNGVAWWLKLWWRFSKQQMDEGPDVFLRSCVGSLLDLFLFLKNLLSRWN